MPDTKKLAEYLFERLRQLGVGSIHGVPGDYNLTLLDFVEPAGLHWVGNCNEAERWLCQQMATHE